MSKKTFKRINPLKHEQFLRPIFLATCLFFTPLAAIAEDEDLFKVSDALVDAHDYQGALKDLDKIAETHPDNDQVFFNRGYVYLDLKDYDNAITNFSKAIEINDFFMSRFARAKAYYEKGLLDKAIEDYESGIDQKNKVRQVILTDKSIDESSKNLGDVDDLEMSAYHFLGQSYENKGNLKKAVSIYTKGISLQPSFRHLYSVRALALSQLGKYQEALNDVNKALEIDPASSLDYFCRALIYSQIGEYEKAIEDSFKAMPDGVHDEALNGVYYVRAVSYLHKGDFEKSAESAKKAIELGIELDQDFLDNLKHKRIPKREHKSEPIRNKFTTLIGE